MRNSYSTNSENETDVPISFCNEAVGHSNSNINRAKWQHPKLELTTWHPP